MARTTLTLDVAHPAARVWALLADDTRVAEVVPGVDAVEVLAPGDGHGNGRVRRLVHRAALGRPTTSVELVDQVARERGFTYRVLGPRPGTDVAGRLRLEPTGPASCRLLAEADAPAGGRLRRGWDRLAHPVLDPYDARALAAAVRWLDDHPAFRADLAA